MPAPEAYVENVFRSTDTLEEIMVRAIKLEKEAANHYGDFLELELPEDLEKKVKTLKFQEEQHEKTFRDIFNDFFPERKIALPGRSGLSSYYFDVDGETPLVYLLERAQRSEKEFELFYGRLKGEFTNRRIKSLIGFLAASEREHYEILRAEIAELQEARN